MWKYVCFVGLICKNISLNTFVQTQIDWHEKIRKNAWCINILNLKWRQVWLKSFIACVWYWFNCETWKIIFMSTNPRYNGIAHLTTICSISMQNKLMNMMKSVNMIILFPVIFSFCKNPLSEILDATFHSYIGNIFYLVRVAI